MSSGVTVADECVEVHERIKMKKDGRGTTRAENSHVFRIVRAFVWRAESVCQHGTPQGPALRHLQDVR